MRSDVLEASFGPEHPEVAGGLEQPGVRRSKAAARSTMRVQAYERALAAKERVLGSEHPSLAITLNNLGVNARKRESYDEAESHYRRVALDSFFDGRVEPDHPNRLLALGNYAKLLRALERNAEAEEFERRREEAAPEGTAEHE